MSSLAKRGSSQRSPALPRDLFPQPPPTKTGVVKLGHPTLAPSDLFSGQKSCEAGTEENGALVAPGSRPVKHISYRQGLKFDYIGISAKRPRKSTP